MGKLEEKSDGNFVLEVTIGCITINKAFKTSDQPLEEVSTIPKPDGLYLYIPDVNSFDSNEED